MTTMRAAGWGRSCSGRDVIPGGLVTARPMLLTMLIGVLLTSPLSAGAANGAPLAATESAYADWLDANYALATIAAGPGSRVGGAGRTTWDQRRIAAEQRLRRGLATLSSDAPDPESRRAIAAITTGLENPPYQPAAPAADTAAVCATAGDTSLERKALSAALYACFEQQGDHLAFEGHSIVRTTALELLQELDSSERRKALFASFAPLWQSLQADGGPSSPYRRLVRLAADEGRKHGGTPVDAALRTVGVGRDSVERWLVAILSAWSAATAGTPVEPWDYWHAHSAASRTLDARVPASRILALSRAYYLDLGADLDRLGIAHDLAVRPGKAPLAYCDYVRIGREVDGQWRAPRARVSGNVEHGGLYVLNEIIHEDGHAVHASAIHVRPAFSAWGDDLFVEAFADVTSWSVAEPAWQQRYLGRSTEQGASLRALYATVMLDVAWGLFELRMLRDPDADPNVVWTDITSRYLHVLPHPELPWWALRVQLVDMPGYMINYGLGAVLTADLRRRTREAIGPFDAGNPRWYAWTTQALLRHGASIATPELLRTFLGRPVSPDALLAELARLGTTPPP